VAAQWAAHQEGLSSVSKYIIIIIIIIIINLSRTETILSKMRKGYMINPSFEVSAEVIFQIMIFWVVTAWSLVGDTQVSETHASSIFRVRYLLVYISRMKRQWSDYLHTSVQMETAFSYPLKGATICHNLNFADKRRSLGR
jgi:hypothetical protein